MTLAYEDMDGPHPSNLPPPLPLGTWVAVNEGRGQLARIRWNPRNGWEYLVDVFRGTVAVPKYILDEATHLGGWDVGPSYISPDMDGSAAPSGAITLTYPDLDAPHPAQAPLPPRPLGQWVTIGGGRIGQLARMRWNPTRARGQWEYLIDFYRPLQLNVNEVQAM